MDFIPSFSEIPLDKWLFAGFLFLVVAGITIVCRLHCLAKGAILLLAAVGSLVFLFGVAW
jgi:hypothetical protein